MRTAMGLISIPLLLLGLGVFILVKLLISYLSTPTSPNPFIKNRVKPLKPKVIDQKLRDERLKQSFALDKVPSDVDAIVIGSGIGGLTTASILSSVGKKVVVLEQHDQAGGCCHTFIDKGYEFDVGIHYVGDMVPSSVTKTLVDQVTEGQLTWEPMDFTYDDIVFSETGKPDRHYPVMGNKDVWKRSLKKNFPDEEQAIDRFFDMVSKASKETNSSMIVKFLPLWIVHALITTRLIGFISKYWMWNSRTVKDVMEDLTNNQELRDIFCYCFGDYGTVPSKTGFTMQALLIDHFQRAGAFYPVGGASEIAYTIIPTIEASGGKVLVKAQVSNILTGSNGKVCGVQVKKNNELYTINAPVVISAAGLYNTFKRLLPPSLASTSRLWPVVNKLSLGEGFSSLFVGLDCPARELAIIHKKNFWVFTKNDIGKTAEDYMELSAAEAEDSEVPLMFISFPSTKDPEWEKKYPDKTTMVIVSLMPFKWVKEWDNEPATRRSNDYEAFKKTLGYKLLDKATELFPTIKDHIDYVNIGSPLSNNHYLGANNGEIYGLDHNQERFSAWMSAQLRPNTDIHGLYLSGQDVAGCGFVGGLMGGVLGAAAVLKRNIFSDLAELHKSINAPNKLKEA